VIARLGANLDQLSGGRWGWNIVPGTKSSESELLGLDDRIDHDQRYAMATETVQAVKVLWGSNGDPVAFDGDFYHFKGTPRGPFPIQQPHPLLFNAGVSPAGQGLIADLCDRAFFAVGDDLDQVRKAVEDLASLADDRGRRPGEIVASGSIGVVVGKTTDEAAEKYQWLREHVDLDAASDWARTFLSRSQSYQSMFGDKAFEEAARKIGIAAGSRVLVGTGAEVAEQMIDIHRRTGLRGFMMVIPVWTIEELLEWADIFPTLEAAGVWTRPADRGWAW
jgi:dimethylsulfone monooxygenase